jgi:hypothetical protein
MAPRKNWPPRTEVLEQLARQVSYAPRIPPLHQKQHVRITHSLDRLFAGHLTDFNDCIELIPAHRFFEHGARWTEKLEADFSALDVPTLD